jgi:hypothetical protein
MSAIAVPASAHLEQAPRQGLLERVAAASPERRDWYSWQIAEATTPADPASLPERTGYVPGIPQGGINEVTQAVGAATGTDRKSLLTELYDAYLACPWSSACVTAIARTITAGGLVSDWDADTGEGNQDEPEKPPEVVALERFWSFCNPYQDIIQLLRNVIADLLVFGDSLLEVVWNGSTPVALYNLDVPTTSPVADEHGNITKYVQVTDFGQRAEFEPHQVIHISLDAARPGVFGVSPTQMMLGPITGWLFAAATEKEMFRKGLPPNVHADMPAGTPDTEITRWRNMYVAQNVGPRNIGNPVVTKGHATVGELQSGKVSDVLEAKAAYRDEIVSGYGCPPAEVGIIESGNLGGGTGDAQHRAFQLNTCHPIAAIVLEKLNFHVAVQGFGVRGWHSKFGEVDYRDSLVIEQIRDLRLRNGSWTRNRYSADIEEPPVEGGDDAFIVNRQSMVLYRDLSAMSAKAAAGTPDPLAPPAIGAGPEPEPDDDERDDEDKGGQLKPEHLDVYNARFREALAAFQSVA